jgi:hypothetical protein
LIALLLMMMGISLYLTYYTFLLFKKTWKEGNKPAGIVILIMAGCFLPLCYILMKT